MSEAERRVARARGLVGVRFRPQGRDPSHGLDCVGLAAAAAGIAAERVRRDYALRGEPGEALAEALLGLGCRPVEAGRARAGDLLVCDAGPGQLHLAVSTGRGIVHADARLRRVVERPGPAPWPVTGAWRPGEEGDD
jgi:cell wall-associated NlpC family hydrolase